MNEQTLAQLAATYVAAAQDIGNKDYWHSDGDSFRFTAAGHTVEVSFAGVDTDEEVGWRVLADGIVVKEEDIDEDDCTVGPSAFEEAWLAIAELIRPGCEAEAKDLFDKISLDRFQKKHLASLD